MAGDFGFEVSRIAYGDQFAVLKEMALTGATSQDYAHVFFDVGHSILKEREGDRTVVNTDLEGELNFPGAHGSKENIQARKRWLRSQPHLYDRETDTYKHPQMSEVAKPGLMDRFSRYLADRKGKKAAKKETERQAKLKQEMYGQAIEALQHLGSNKDISHNHLQEVINMMQWMHLGEGGGLDQEQAESGQQTLEQAPPPVEEQVGDGDYDGLNSRERREMHQSAADLHMATNPPKASSEISDSDEEGLGAAAEEIQQAAAEGGEDITEEEALEIAWHALHETKYSTGDELDFLHHHWPYSTAGMPEGVEGFPTQGEGSQRTNFWSKNNFPLLGLNPEGKRVIYNPVAEMFRGDEDASHHWMDALRAAGVSATGHGQKGKGAARAPHGARLLMTRMLENQANTGKDLLASGENGEVDWDHFASELEAAKQFWASDPYGIGERFSLDTLTGSRGPDKTDRQTPQLGHFSRGQGGELRDWVGKILPHWMGQQWMTGEGGPLEMAGLTPENHGQFTESMGKRHVLEEDKRKASRTPTGTGNYATAGTEGGNVVIDQNKVNEAAGGPDTGTMTEGPSPCEIQMPGCQGNATGLDASGVLHTCESCKIALGGDSTIAAGEPHLELDPFNLAWGRLLKGRD